VVPLLVDQRSTLRTHGSLKQQMFTPLAALASQQVQPKPPGIVEWINAERNTQTICCREMLLVMIVLLDTVR
jgi:hypothetical protein